MQFPLFLALKYLKPKRSVASVITLVSILGVMLGVAVVIIVRSVMTGFGDIWEEKILDFKPHVSLLPTSGVFVEGEDQLAAAIRKIPGVTCVTPEIDTRVLLSHRGRVLAPVLIGVDGDDFKGAYRVGEPRAGTYNLEGDTLVIGSAAARSLGVWVGDEVTVYSPKISRFQKRLCVVEQDLFVVADRSGTGKSVYRAVLPLAQVLSRKRLSVLQGGRAEEIHVSRRLLCDAERVCGWRKQS